MGAGAVAGFVHDTATVDIVDPSIRVTKAAGNAPDGDTEFIDGTATVTYTYDVTNTGDTHLSDIEVIDDAGTPAERLEITGEYLP